MSTSEFVKIKKKKERNLLKQSNTKENFTQGGLEVYLIETLQVWQNSLKELRKQWN